MKTRLELIKEATAKYLRQKKHFDKKAGQHEKSRNIWQSASGDTPILHRTSEVNYHSSAADNARKEAAIRQAKINARKKRVEDKKK